MDGNAVERSIAEVQMGCEEDQLREAITGKTIYLNISGFELPIYYKANGRMTGSMGKVAATFSRGDDSRDSGRWWLEGNQLCRVRHGPY
jgi:hypothetical protein